MRTYTGMIASAVGMLGLLCSSAARAQMSQPVPRAASLASGVIEGVVQDENGSPVAGATVSALGATTSAAITDSRGRFELRGLSPGPYVVRAHLSGFASTRGRVVQVNPSGRVVSSIPLRRAIAAAPGEPAVVPASVTGLFVPSAGPPQAQPADSPGTTTSDMPEPAGQGEGETAWRLRHARRSVLKDEVDGAVWAADDSPADGHRPDNLLDRAVGSAAVAATSFFADTQLVGQVDLLTTGVLETPSHLFTTPSFERNVAFVALGAPVGDYADWTVRGAVTQGDISSWIVSGEYSTRLPARHRYDVGMSYARQRYEGANPSPRVSPSDGSLNAGMVYAFDTFVVSPIVSVTYGAQYARYDYLGGRSLLSPRLAVTVSPTHGFRINALASRHALAPGAGEFMPASGAGVWLPPQRTFSSLVDGRPLRAERTTHVEAGLERDLSAGATLSVRVFRQRVDRQLVTLFDAEMPDLPPAAVGHYFVAEGNRVDAVGYGAGISTIVADRVHGSLHYTMARARWNPAGDDLAYLLLLPTSAVRVGLENVHDVSASVETTVPETATRVLVLYRVSNGFARTTGESPAVDSRFDLQVRQSLPFMDFSSAKWEMLVSVRDFFYDAALDQSIFDELLAVRPPKRVVGGLTLRF